jgi:predicted metal-binding membrane protein
MSTLSFRTEVPADRPPGAPTSTWWTRENLLPALALLLLTAVAWGYTLWSAAMHDMAMADGLDLLLFLIGWGVMMAAMMLPAILPLILLYRATARAHGTGGPAGAGMAALLGGYLGLWTFAGLPVYGYSELAAGGGAGMAVLPGLLLIAGGVYQFTTLKHRCHARCSSPLFFLAREWRPGLPGALRLGVLHGLDCLGCCLGLMAALVALGMMNVAWMLTAAVIIFAEKTLPWGHRAARPLGIVLVLGGILILWASLD